MRDISERVSYLQGLSEGLSIKENSPQGKIITGILKVLDDIAEEIDGINEQLSVYKDYVDSIDQDLMDLEDMMGIHDDDGDYVSLVCKNCGEKVMVDSDFFDDENGIEFICPKCNEVIYINDAAFDYEDEGTHDFDSTNLEQH